MDTPRFWEHHPDSTQAAVHFALQWLAFVYPTSEKHLDATLREALPYSDEELGQRWRVFLEEKDIDAHVEALKWLSSTLSKEQLPLIESCWRLLLVDHDLPSHVPLALRLLGRVLKVPEFHILDIGKKVQRETEQTPTETPRTPLLPEDPRYLDRVEWRLYGMSDPIRRTSYSENDRHGGRMQLTGAFLAGLIVGIGSLAFLVWGPPQLGREPVPRMSHQSGAAPATGSLSNSAAGVEAPTGNEGTEPVLNASGFDQSALPEADPDQSSALTAPSDTQAAEPADESPEDPATATVADSETEQASEPDTASQQPVPESDTDTTAEAVTNAPDVLMRVTASILNVRAAPSTNADIIIKLGEGARVWMEPEGAVGGWNRIRVEGQVGYASSNFMEPVN